MSRPVLLQWFRRFVLAGVAWCCVLLSNSAPAWAEGTVATNLTELDHIKQKGRLEVVMFFEDVPPFFMHNRQGSLVGIDPQLAQDIAEKLGVEVSFNRQPQTFDAVIDRLRLGDADIAISLLSDTLNRALQVNFSEEYVVLRQTLLVNRLQLAQRFPKAQTNDEIRVQLNQGGLKIGVIEGTSYVDFLKADYPLATPVLYSDFKRMIRDVETGELFALLYDELEVLNWRYDHPDIGLRLKMVLLGDRKDTIAIAVNRQDKELLAWLNLYLAKIRNDGSLDRLIKTYLEKSDWRTQ
ncbi:amino acid ABC transporter substrate-binding protein [filamentous cyanobacterium CCT1]|nr:amino acid ABC transporter substrate-binding protein [filamentous cyanobacterium CCT1]PSN78659.1 amino acid ABC transporter substrate-binding protein [filamentous cyanobacterium CCP4]